MALVVKDRVQVTSTTTGTGTFTLGSAVAGFQDFSVIGDGNTTYYAIVGGTEWEVGLGTYTSSGTTLSRDTILESSNSGSAVNFSAGTKTVFVTYPAEKSVTTDVIGTIASQNSNNVSITGGSIAVSADPTTSLQVATKQYVDAAISGLHVHDAVAAATTSALSGTVTYDNGTSGVGATLTLGTALTTLDGWSLSNGDRILVKNQDNAAHNGIYTWATGGTVLTRATDADTPLELNGGDFFFVVHGTVNNDTGWVITAPVTTIGTSNVTFTQFSGAGTYTAGTGLTLTGSQFSLTTPVAVANGGTGTSTAFTTGSVVFAGASGVYSQNNAGFFWDNTNSRLGIGTTSPAVRLHIKAAASTFVNFAQENTNGGTDAKIVDWINNGNTYSLRLLNDAYNAANTAYSVERSGYTISNHAWYTGSGTERMRIDSSGNVGIGTTSPISYVGASGGLVVAQDVTLVNNTTQPANNYSRFFQLSGVGPSISGFQFTVNTGGNATTAPTERMRIDSSGNVGIGVTPSAWTGGFKPLQIVSSSIAGYDDGAGNIQTEINTNLYQSMLGTYNYIKSHAALQYRQLNGAGHVWLTAPSGTAGASVNPTERMRIDFNGNVGIGTTSPTSGYKLDVAGNFKVLGSIDENIYAVVDAAGVALSPQNGTIQTWTLGASRTPTLGTWNAGESMTLMINDGTAYTVTWTTMGIVWVGGTAPTLATTGFTVIELWRVGSTYYGALVGNVA